MPIYSLKHPSLPGLSKSLFFPHCPKTASTTLDLAFRSAGASVYLHKEPKFELVRHLFKGPPQHWLYEQFDAVLDLERFDFTFIVVRHPVDRLISDYFWFKKHSTNIDTSNIESWFDFLVDELRASGPTVVNDISNHFIPQSGFYGNKIQKIYKLESGLETIFQDVCRQLELKVTLPPAGLPRVNERSASEKIQINDRLLSKIKDYYAEDYRIFGYA